MTKLLDRAAIFRGCSQAVRTDNGPEFTCRTFMTWAQTTCDIRCFESPEFWRFKATR